MATQEAMASKNETLITLVSGGIGGTMGAVLTCPLEVIKTRLQASETVLSRRNAHVHGLRHTSIYYTPEVHWNLYYTQHCPINSRLVVFPESVLPWNHHIRTWEHIRQIVVQEGKRALFKGLGANIIGVAPTRAIYFCTYHTAKKRFNQIFTPNSHTVHMCAAGSAGFVASTVTNPIWFVKTRIQLDRSKKVTARQCVANIYGKQGITGFYKGISASYFGISETIINFVLYEYLKETFKRGRQTAQSETDDKRDAFHLGDYMIASAFSKTVACCIAYPHEVARTRLRQENSRYRGFFQTLATIYREEGYRGLYRGLGTQLVRQIPNMAILMTTYETSVYLLTEWFGDEPINRPVSPSANFEESKSDS